MDVETLKEILADQKEELKQVYTEERIVEREFLNNWKPLMDGDLIKVITGIRRSGKSTFSLQMLADKSFGYVNFDDERLIGLTSNDLNTILQTLYETQGAMKFIFLDEIQNIEGWELFVNRLKRARLNVIVTGSNAKLLGRELATHLTGRHIPLEILPFSFREFLDYDRFEIKPPFSTKQKAFLLKKLHEYLEVGGFPEALKNRPNSKRYLTTLYSTILTKDVVSRQRIKYIKTIREISNYLVSNFAQATTFNKIKNAFDLKSPHTSKNYVSHLEESYLLFLVDKFSFKHRERAASPKKIYAIDTGIVNALAFKSSRDLGRLMENLVFLELMRKKAIDNLLEIYYWKDYIGHEVDFVLKKGTEPIQLIQVTYASSMEEIKKRETKALIKASRELKCKKLLIITWDLETKEKNINFKPLWKWLLSH